MLARDAAKEKAATWRRPSLTSAGLLSPVPVVPLAPAADGLLGGRHEGFRLVQFMLVLGGRIAA